MLSAAQKYQVPIMVFAPCLLPEMLAVAREFPDLPLVIDHFGLPQPPMMQADPEPFGALADLLPLAACPNVAVKFCGAPTLSGQEFPFDDVWPHLMPVVDAFTPQRLMWASDYQRVPNYTLTEAVAFVRDTGQLSETDKEWLLGRAVRQFMRWDI
jgi:L-fuconolactonase